MKSWRQTEEIIDRKTCVIACYREPDPEEPLEVPLRELSPELPPVIPPPDIPPPDVPPEPDDPPDMLLPPELLPLEPVPPGSPRWQPKRNALRIAIAANTTFEECFIVFPFYKSLYKVLSRLFRK